MGQEFVIKSTALEDKINQLLPSQGGSQAGVDLSASTTIIPVVNLTETAEGSLLRQDLQTALDFANTAFNVVGATATLITTTGFFRVIGTATGHGGNNVDRDCNFFITDGVTDKAVWKLTYNGIGTQSLFAVSFDFIVFLRAGDSLRAISPATDTQLSGSTRQIADISGNLTNPLGF